MRCLAIGTFLYALLCSASVHADASALSRQLADGDGWVAYTVAIVADAGSPCCYSGNMGGDFSKTRCNLDAGKGTLIAADDAHSGSAGLSVYWHVSNGKLDKVKAFAADCPVTSARAMRWITPVASSDSVALLEEWIGHGYKGRDSELAALALHADERATAALIDFIEPGRDRELRKDAVFWLGQSRGAAGAGHVARVATEDPDADLREHAVFSLSQSKEATAYERILAISRQDASSAVRGKALFWMAQMHDPRAQADIIAALKADVSEEVREEAVFALSELDDTEAVRALISVVRGSYPKPVKEKALFWLAQADSEEAMAFFEQMLTREP